jgi:hypothetical protein
MQLGLKAQQQQMQLLWFNKTIMTKSSSNDGSSIGDGDTYLPRVVMVTGISIGW